MPLLHSERHMVARIGWLRAAVLGANDGIISTASLILGVASASGGRAEIMVAGVAALVAGAMSMAAGEYVSVSSQADVENADVAKESWELANQPDSELAELVQIYVDRGLNPVTAQDVAQQLTAHDALQSHLRDELGLNEDMAARPVQAAFASALSFAAGAAIPLVVLLLTSVQHIAPVIVITALIALAILGALGAKAGGAGKLRALVRVMFWGALAMGTTALIGQMIGGVVG